MVLNKYVRLHENLAILNMIVHVLGLRILGLDSHISLVSGFFFLFLLLILLLVIEPPGNNSLYEHFRSQWVSGRHDAEFALLLGLSVWIAAVDIRANSCVTVTHQTDLRRQYKKLDNPYIL